MRKLSVFVFILVLLVGGVVYAEEVTPARRGLTEEQRAELESIWSQMAELRQQLQDKMVEFGRTNPERAEWKQGRERGVSEEISSRFAHRHGEEAETPGRHSMIRGRGGTRGGRTR